MKTNVKQQPYDGALKGLFEKHATLIIPYLLPMVRLEATPLVEDDEAEEQTEEENRAEEKQIIEEELKVQYQIDPLIRENPTVVSIVAEAEAKAETRGEVKGLQKAVLAIVSHRFSTPVVSQIQQTITSSQNIEQLQNFLGKAAQASDEQEVLSLLAGCFPHQDEISPLVTENPTIRAIATESEAKGVRDSILDVASAHFSSQVVTQVQHTITPIQDIQQLRKFLRQLTRASNEQEVYALLTECFPAH